MSPSAIMPDQFSTLGKLLRHLRRQARLTQGELAIAVGYSDTQISRIKQGQRVPDVERTEARLRQQLGEAEFRHAYQAGCKMSLEETVGLALKELEQSWQ